MKNFGGFLQTGPAKYTVILNTSDLVSILPSY